MFMMKRIFKIVALIIFFLYLTTGGAGAEEIEGTLDTGVQSGVGSMDGIIKSAPTASPSAGSYSSSQSITLTAGGSTAICYTSDGTTPACATPTTCTTGTKYTEIFSVTSTTTIKSIACYADDSSGSSSSDAYTITAGGGGGGGAAVSAPVTAAPETVVSSEEPLVLTSSQEGTLARSFTDNSEVAIEIPIGTVEAETTFNVEQAELVTYEAPLEIETVGATLVGNMVFEITATDVENAAVRSFSRAVTITITVPDLPEDTSNLGLYYYNEGTDSWGLIPGAQFDSVTGEVTFDTDHFTKFAIFEIAGTPYFLPVDLSLIGVEGILEKDLVKTDVSSAVYQILSGQRHIFPHLEVYLSWGYAKDFSTVKTITAADLEQYPEGDAVPFRDGSLFRGTTQSVHGKSASAVFYVEDGKLRAIQSAEIYQGLFNDSDWSLVTWVPDDLLDKFTYPLGEMVIRTDIHPNGCLVRYADSSAVYLIENGKKRPFTSWNAFVANGYEDRPILIIPDTEIYETTEVISALAESLTTPVFAAFSE